MNIRYLGKKFENESFHNFEKRVLKDIWYEPEYSIRKFVLEGSFLNDVNTNEKFCFLGELNDTVNLINNNGVIFEGRLLFENGFYFFKDGIEYRENGLKKYEGNWKRGSYHGAGIEYHFYYKEMVNNERYRGYFKNGKYEGHGKLYDIEKKMKFEGEFKNGLKNGYGKFFWKDRLLFEGNHKNGIRNGHGTQYDKKYFQKIYEGNYKNNDKWGQGVSYCVCGSRDYMGEFKYNLKHGYGIVFNCKGHKKYQGDFKDDNYHGIGKLYYEEDKLHIEAHFQHGDIHGYGVEFSRNGNKIYEGQWKESKYNGKGVLYSLESKKEGDFKNGVCINDVKDMRIRQFLETGDKTKIKGITTKYLQKYSGEEIDRKTILSNLQKKKLEKKEDVEDSEYDLFGNKIEFPCYGDDDGVYDITSMRHLFKTNSKGEFENISYVYNKKNERVPNFPIMNKGKPLTSWYCPSMNNLKTLGK